MKKLLIITPYTPDNQGRGVSPTSRFLHEVSKSCLVDLVYFRYAKDVVYKPINANVCVVKEILVGVKKEFMQMHLEAHDCACFICKLKK